jgi:hypothetical protein
MVIDDARDDSLVRRLFHPTWSTGAIIVIVRGLVPLLSLERLVSGVKQLEVSCLSIYEIQNQFTIMLEEHKHSLLEEDRSYIQEISRAYYESSHPAGVFEAVNYITNTNTPVRYFVNSQSYRLLLEKGRCPMIKTMMANLGREELLVLGAFTFLSSAENAMDAAIFETPLLKGVNSNKSVSNRTCRSDC